MSIQRAHVVGTGSGKAAGSTPALVVRAADAVVDYVNGFAHSAILLAPQRQLVDRRALMDVGEISLHLRSTG
jgi:hypothetical protein